MKRLALGLEYDGSRFYGWQIQRQTPTVQGVLEQALSRVADEPVQVACGGRTDTGVHALCQVVHFDTRAVRHERAWVLGVNSRLPAGVSALWIRAVPDDFHARFSATGRSYRYRILNRWVRPAVARDHVAWEREPLDAGRMHEAAQQLLGEHDFSSFRAAGCQARHPVRTISAISVRRDGDEVIIDVSANGFLYHMVRNISGSLMAIGRGRQEVQWLARVLQAADRRQGGVTAPPGGLYFLGPSYPAAFALPSHPLAPFPRGWNAS